MSDKALSVMVVFGIGPLLPSEGPLLVRNAVLLVTQSLLSLCNDTTPSLSATWSASQLPQD